ncbi:MAG: IS21-like element helper ATPase IstB [Lentilactobacillus diolivorans]|jgi:DNA replication protein DnaC|uniref:IS21-like element helper ATPase IstB n=1 Tax=Levilactobacillus brevis TaxID=1580 RepID=UPI0021A74638|nr:IS21-like element helper ATPase IstB [Levilactobacillus brevis]MCH4163792.1 IS21-like element helper ATPase IstB [Lentilactobacillus diolivorans]MCT3574073.1 AAA family ATPase [Levilactobacillus brevis]
MNQQTFDKMMTMRMTAMAKTYQELSGRADTAELSLDEFTEVLIDTEFDHRQQARITRLIHNAAFSDDGRLEAISYLPDRELNREVFVRLASNQYINEPRNVIFTGATGSGKSYLACALGNNACQSGYKVRYIRLPDLLIELELARAQGTYKKVLRQYQNCELLILDEWLLVPATDIAQQDILEVIERRYRYHATIFCSQFEVDGWHDRLGGGAVADAILDRATAKSQLISVKGNRSMRTR